MAPPPSHSAAATVPQAGDPSLQLAVSHPSPSPAATAALLEPVLRGAPPSPVVLLCSPTTRAPLNRAATKTSAHRPACRAGADPSPFPDLQIWTASWLPDLVTVSAAPLPHRWNTVIAETTMRISAGSYSPVRLVYLGRTEPSRRSITR